MKTLSILAFSAVSMVVIPHASAVVVWADDFTGETDGALPSGDYPGGLAGDDWTEVNPPSASLVYAISGGRLRQTDTATAGTNSTVSRISRSQWATTTTLNSTNNILRVSLDMQVNSFLTTDNTNPRLVLRDTATAGNHFVLGWGKGTAGAPNNQLSFYAQGSTDNTTTFSPNDGNAVGFGASGFGFGAYSTTAADNDTGSNYRITFEYNFNSGGIVGTITNLTTLETASFNASMNAGLDFDAGAADDNDGLLLASGGNATSDTFWDNINIEIVPEPSTLMLGLGGLGLLFVRRRSA